MVSQTSVNDETNAALKARPSERKKELLHTTTAGEKKTFFEQRAFDVDILRGLLFFLFLYTRRYARLFVYTQYRRMTLDDNLFYTIITYYECGHILLIFRSKKTPSFLVKRFLQRDDDDKNSNHQQKALLKVVVVKVDFRFWERHGSVVRIVLRDDDDDIFATTT